MLCARALARGDWAAAYRLADRRCRIRPLADAHCFVLRGEALYRMGERSAAIEDVLEAVHIAPDDVSANRRLLAWGTTSQQVSAAKVLVDCDRDVRVQREAVAALRASGKTAVASLRVYDDVVEGWAAWCGDGQLRLMTTDGQNRVERFLDGDPHHPLAAELGCAAGFRLRRGAASQSVSVLNGNEVVAALPAAGRDALPPVAVAPSQHSDGDTVTVIVPVYGDYRATKTCLHSLLAQVDPCRHRLIVVNDASPDPRIHRLLDSLIRRADVRVLTNPHNLGFVGAVNRALDEVRHGDVLLLNSDTIVPAGFIERLAAAAHSERDVATVTPLSNNGEFTSFPVPNRPNPIDGLEIADIDRIAANVNAGRVIDIPNGIGFCLYITRGCLDVVGRLSDSYCRGYLEDVDLCLRARQHGLRNVCAPSVYVGHAGSRSFGKQKRSLVVRNLKIVEQRFPTYRSECADFLRADPLRPARQAIEASLIAARRGGILLVTGDGAVADVARARAGRLIGDGARGVLILEIQYRAGRIVARLRDPDDGAPQSIDLVFPADLGELLRMLWQLELSRVELFDLARLPRTLVEGIRDLPVPYDLFLAHAELGLDYGAFLKPPQSRSKASFWRNVVAEAGCVIVPDAAAEMLARTLTPDGIKRLPHTAPHRRRRLPPVSRPVRHIGLVAVRGCAEEHNFLREATTRLARARPGFDIVVVGSTHDELALMRAGAFVTGATSGSELIQLAARYRLERLVICMTRPLFGHPIVEEAMGSGLPVAYFDWSNGQCSPREGDLALDPSLAPEAICDSLLPWLGRAALQ
jgi:GT2 family glycosyltransferase